VIPSGLNLKFLPRQAEILDNRACACAGVAERLVSGVPDDGLRAVRRRLRRPEMVIMQEIDLPVAGLNGGDGAATKVNVIHLRGTSAVSLLQQITALIVLE